MNIIFSMLQSLIYGTTYRMPDIQEKQHNWFCQASKYENTCIAWISCPKDLQNQLIFIIISYSGKKNYPLWKEQIFTENLTKKRKLSIVQFWKNNLITLNIKYFGVDNRTYLAVDGNTQHPRWAYHVCNTYRYVQKDHTLNIFW